MCKETGYRVIPILCQCHDPEALQQRHQARVQEIGAGNTSGAKIDIRLDDLYARICAAFEPPALAEGYFVIDTCRPLDESVTAVQQLFLSEETNKL
jgi:hypothetical protein